MWPRGIGKEGLCKCCGQAIAPVFEWKRLRISFEPDCVISYCDFLQERLPPQRLAYLCLLLHAKGDLVPKSEFLAQSNKPVFSNLVKTQISYLREWFIEGSMPFDIEFCDGGYRLICEL